MARLFDPSPAVFAPLFFPASKPTALSTLWALFVSDDYHLRERLIAEPAYGMQIVGRALESCQTLSIAVGNVADLIDPMLQRDFAHLDARSFENGPPLTWRRVHEHFSKSLDPITQNAVVDNCAAIDYVPAEQMRWAPVSHHAFKTIHTIYSTLQQAPAVYELTGTLRALNEIVRSQMDHLSLRTGIPYLEIDDQLMNMRDGERWRVVDIHIERAGAARDRYVCGNDSGEMRELRLCDVSSALSRPNLALWPRYTIPTYVKPDEFWSTRSGTPTTGAARLLSKPFVRLAEGIDALASRARGQVWQQSWALPMQRWSWTHAYERADATHDQFISQLRALTLCTRTGAEDYEHRRLQIAQRDDYNLPVDLRERVSSRLAEIGTAYRLPTDALFAALAYAFGQMAAANDQVARLPITGVDAMDGFAYIRLLPPSPEMDERGLR